MGLDLDAIRAKWLQVCGACDAGIGQQCSHPGDDYRPVILDLLTEVATLTEEFAEARAAMDPAVIEAERAEVAALTAERDRLREHILDIDAHATPYGDIPDEPGFVGVYLVTAGALHRALGKIGHSAPKCKAEADLAFLLAEGSECDARLEAAESDRDAALASLTAEREQTARTQAELAQYRSLGTAAQPVAMTLVEGTITVGDALDAGAAALNDPTALMAADPNRCFRCGTLWTEHEGRWQGRGVCTDERGSEKR